VKIFRNKGQVIVNLFPLGQDMDKIPGYAKSKFAISKVNLAMFFKKT
jgi:hypothetical protein